MSAKERQTLLKMTNKPPILLIDGNNMAHRAYHTHQLSYKGKSVSIIYGVPHMVRALISQFKPYKVIVVWDGDRHPERMRLNPDYKQHRALQQKDRLDLTDFHRQKKVAQRLLKRLGVAQVVRRGMEADDYIYMLSQKLYQKRPVIICSNDKDFHQLICPGISQFMDKKTLRRELTHLNFEEIFGVKPSQWVDYLCLTGDSTDDIKGYHGIGEKKGIKFLQDYGSILDYLEGEKEDKLPEKVELKRIYGVNQMLIDLELFYMTHLHKKVEIEYLFNSKSPKINRIKLNTLAMKYNLRSFIKPTFTKPFER